jgi:threonine/homoserine/homoserine lactone efflux protein
MSDWNLVQTSQLGAYAVLLVGIVLLPGMDMAFVLGKSLVGGGRAGAAALAGIVAGGVVHNVVATLGVGIVVRSMPWLSGAAWSVWLALRS